MASILQNHDYCSIRGNKWLLLAQNQYQKDKVFLQIYLKKLKTISIDKNKSEIDKNDLELSNHNNKIPTNIDKNPLNESNSFSEGIGRKIVKDISEISDENKNTVEYIGNKENNEIIKSSNKTISIDDASSFISSGVVLGKSSEISNI